MACGCKGNKKPKATKKVVKMPNTIVRPKSMPKPRYK